MGTAADHASDHSTDNDKDGDRDTELDPVAGPLFCSRNRRYEASRLVVVWIACTIRMVAVVLNGIIVGHPGEEKLEKKRGM